MGGAGRRQARRAGGWPRKTWALQAHRRAAAAARAPAGNANGLLSTPARHWPKGIWCHLVLRFPLAQRNLLFPLPRAPRSPSHPFLLGFSSTGPWASARHPAASEALGSFLSAFGNGGAGTSPGLALGHVANGWARGKCHRKQQRSHGGVLPSGSQGVVGGETWLQSWGRDLRGLLAPAALPSERLRLGPRGTMALPRPPLREATRRPPTSPGLRASGRTSVRTCVARHVRRMFGH